MPPMPPLKVVLSSLQYDVLPAAGVAAFVLCLFLFLGRWAGALGSAAAITLAFMTANFTLATVGFEDQPTWENTARLISWKPGENAPGWQWLPRAALVLVVVGLLSRWVGLLAGRFLPERHWWGVNLLVWAPRLAAIAVVSEWLVLGTAAAAPEWKYLRYQLAAAMIGIWIALDGVARADAGAEVAAYMAAAFFAAAMMLILAHTKRHMDLAVILGCAMFAIAVVSSLGSSDASGAVPVAVAFLPGLVLGTQPSLGTHKIPQLALWLVSLAPLALSPFLISALNAKRGRVVVLVRATLVLAPLAAAVIMATQHEVLAFDE